MSVSCDTLSVQPQPTDEFVQQLVGEMLEFCGPIFIAPGLHTRPDQMLDSGTFSLIDTGQKRLLVTCHHVWEGFLESRKGNPETVLALNLGDGDLNIAFSRPELRLIDCDPHLDLAVFDFEPGQLKVNDSQVNHQKAWFPIGEWPISKAKKDDYIVLMGFSGNLIIKGQRLCTFTSRPIPLKISGVGQKEIYIFNEAVNTEVINWIKSDLGGLSGSPAYKIGENGASLVGFVKAGSKRRADGQPLASRVAWTSPPLAAVSATRTAGRWQ